MLNVNGWHGASAPSPRSHTNKLTFFSYAAGEGKVRREAGLYG